MSLTKSLAVFAVLASLFTVNALPAVAAGGSATDRPPVPVSIPAGQLTETQAIAKVHELFGALPQLKHVYAHYDPNSFRNNGPVWEIGLYEEDPSLEKWDQNYADGKRISPAPKETYSVSLDARTGDVIAFDHQNPAWQSGDFPTPETAINAAKVFLNTFPLHLNKDLILYGVRGGFRNMYPKIEGSQDLYQWSSYDVEFQELVNSIPFVNNVVRVRVDAFGHVVGLQVSLNKDSSKLPKPDGTITKADAVKLFSDNLHVQKAYHVYPDHSALEYDVFTPHALDAFTGKPVTDDFHSEPPTKPQSFALQGSGPLVAKDKENAKQLVAQLAHTDLSAYQSKEQDVMDDQGNVSLWRFDFGIEPKDPSRYSKRIEAEFDAKTGRLVRFTADPTRDPAVPFVEMQVSSAQQIALDELKQLLPTGDNQMQLFRFYDENQAPSLPDWVDASKLPERGSQNHAYRFMFVNEHQGVPVETPVYEVSIDSITGHLLDLSLPQIATSYTLPDNVNTVSETVIKQNFLRDNKLRLVYSWPEYMGQTPATGRLIYQLDDSNSFLQSPSYLDAFTGERVFLPDTNK